MKGMGGAAQERGWAWGRFRSGGYGGCVIRQADWELDPVGSG